MITEVSEGGSVPELRVVNKGDARILVLDGEELRGAKQNRVLNTTHPHRQAQHASWSR